MALKLLAHLELQTQGRLRPAAGGGPGPCGSVPAGPASSPPAPGRSGTPTPSCALTSQPGSPSPASQGLAFPPRRQVRIFLNENTTRASWKDPCQAGAGAGPGGIGVMGGPCLTGFCPLPPRHRLCRTPGGPGGPGRGQWLQLREVLSLLPTQDQPEGPRAPHPPRGRRAA